MKLLIALLPLLFSATVFAKKDCSDEKQFENVSLAEMQKLAKDDSVTIIDVNSLDSFEKNRIGKAVHFGSHKKDIQKVLPKNKSSMIVAYCGGPGCGAWKRAAKAACELNYTNIRHFKSGIKGWKAPKKG